MNALNPFEVLDDDRRRAAMRITCGFCGARPGMACVSRGRNFRSLSHGRMHPSRIDTATVPRGRTRL